MGEHSGRYTYPARYFSPTFPVYAIDLRGHGRSEGPAVFTARWEDFLDDIDAFVTLIREKEQREPFLIGHSFGGQLVINYFASGRGSKIPGFVAASPNIRLAMRVKPAKRVLARLLSGLTPRLILKSDIPTRMISHDPEVVRQYEQDPLVSRKITTRLGALVLEDQESIMARASRLKTPCLFLHGGGDRICSPEGTREFFEKIPIEDKTIKIYEGYYHELFNEIGKEAVFHDMQKWIENHLG